jgi:hypothetical protein
VKQKFLAGRPILAAPASSYIDLIPPTEVKAMNAASALILSTLFAVVSTSAFGQRQLPDADTNLWFEASNAANASIVPAPSDPQSLPLFKIGRLPVRVYAPVPPPYNAAANRNFAANPVWGPEF